MPLFGMGGVVSWLCVAQPAGLAEPLVTADTGALAWPDGHVHPATAARNVPGGTVPAVPAAARSFAVPAQLDLQLTVGPTRHGPYDPTMRVTPREVVRASHTPDGPGTVHLRIEAERARAEAWGPGADWLLHQAPTWLGCHDDPSPLAPQHELLAKAVRRFPGLRIGASGLVADGIVQAILGQKVTAEEAHSAWSRLVRRYGRAAPGEHEGLRLAPTTDELAALPYDAFHPLGVERKRADIITRACARIDRLQEAATMPSDEAQRRLTALPGLGPWTAGLVRRHCFGDPDAVEWGDFHIPNHVCWNLAGEPRGTDVRMAELLEPYAGQRGRALRLILLAGQGAPRRGPRMPVKRRLVPRP